MDPNANPADPMNPVATPPHPPASVPPQADVGEKRKRDDGPGFDNDTEQKTVFIKGLPPNATIREVRNMFAFCPGFVEASIWTPGQGTHMAAFALMDCNARAVEVCQALNGFMFDRDPVRMISTELARKNLRNTGGGNGGRPRHADVDHSFGYAPRGYSGYDQMQGYQHQGYDQMGQMSNPYAQQQMGQGYNPYAMQQPGHHPYIPPGPKTNHSGPPSEKIFVGGVSRDITTDATFENFFNAMGDVVECCLAKDPMGNSKGFGFVTMASIDQAAAIVDRGTMKLDGRTIECKFAVNTQRR